MAAASIPLMPEARFALNQRRQASVCGEVFDVLDTVKDPEIPVLSIWDLGILQDVERRADGSIEVTITPTYSGCPAMAQISEDIVDCLNEAGYPTVTITQRLTPAWTTDWIDAATRKRLREYGIAGPESAACPLCGSTDTEVISEFGSTACKALMKCNSCLEPFDQFKRL